MAGILLVATECMIPEKALKENILSISYEKNKFLLPRTDILFISKYPFHFFAM